ncbi:MAG: sodium/proline symporter PutP [Eubacteriaceae bacterium]|nr:sodium/proline symporter PutP [Eubacteriaceae bacterium]
MITSQTLIMMTIGAYLIFMIAVGFYFTRKNNNVSDFYLGGRQLGPFVTAMSAEASDMSSWLLMGLPGVAYLTGICDAAWTAIGLAIGTYINWLVIAKRVRVYTSRTNAITLPDFFSKRYKDDKNLLNLIAAVIIIIFFIPYTASGFAACGKLFSSLFGVDYVGAMVISAVVIVAYTALGGFFAASTTDFIQSIIMTVALVVVLGYGVTSAGGFDTVMANAKELSGYLSLNAMHDFSTDSSVEYGLISKISTLAWGLGYFGMPHVLLRFMAIEDKEKLKMSRRIATVWVVISLSVAIFIGIVGYGMTQAGAFEFLEGSSAETVIVVIAKLISACGPLAAIVAGLILAGILAATMSTADSQLLAASSSVAQNILRDFFKINISEKGSMIVARLAVIAISVVAVFLATNPDSSVFEIVSFAWAGFGATFGPLVICALFWKRSNKQGAMAGLIAGAVTIFVWKYAVRPMGGALNIYELLPAFILALVVNIAVSLMTAPPSEEVKAEYDAYVEALHA